MTKCGSCSTQPGSIPAPSDAPAIATVPGRSARLIGEGLIFLITVYQRILSPVIPATCRFVPSCSQYACEAINRYGPVRGLALAARRIWRCRPFGESGYDPVR